MQVSAPSDLRLAFREHDRTARLRYSKVAHALMIVLVPAGASLDWFVYPEVAAELSLMRILVAVMGALALALHYTPFVRRNIRVFAMLLPIVINAAIAWMVFRTEGAVSPYYAGLNLVLAGVGVLSTWTFGEAAILCGVTLAVYVWACAAHGDLLANAPILYSNIYFLVLTAVITTTAAYFKSRLRFEEFRLGSELARSYRQISELERLKTDFYANVSHELRTPLTLIVAPLQELAGRRADLPDPAGELIRIAHENALRLLKLINDLLDLAHLESEEFTLKSEQLELGQFTANQIEMVRPMARLKRLTLSMEPVAEALWTQADPGHFEKILVNLLTNAIKFTEQDGRIVVSGRREAGAGVIEVSDTGIGIPAHELPHVFERFRQVAGSGGQGVRGVGIGLALAKELAEKHGGTLTVRSQVGQGSVFRLELPLVDVDRAAGGAPVQAVAAGRGDDSLARIFWEADRFLPASASSTLPRSVEAGEDGKRGRVLVIDDEPDIRRYLSSVLSDEYVVLEAEDGERGVALAKQVQPELVIVDLMMPGLDGFGVARALKRENGDKTPKVIVLTASTDEMSKINALKSGADDFLSKPFSTLEIRTRLANLRHTHALETSLHDQNDQLRDALVKLRAAEARLVQREKMKAVVTLAGGILHEINNPLNYTLAAIDIAQQRYGKLQLELASILDDVRTGMQRIRDIVVDLRSFANPASDEKRERFLLGPLVERALRFTAIELRGVVVESDVKGDAMAFGSKSQILQVLTNLLVNAGAAARAVQAEREPRICVRAEVSPLGSRVAVWDNGHGIPAILIDKVFDPFLTTREVGQGMGLGLSICHALIVAHGGAISIRSEQGSWTEVVFELPGLQEKESAA